MDNNNELHLGMFITFSILSGFIFALVTIEGCDKADKKFYLEMHDKGFCLNGHNGIGARWVKCDEIKEE